MKKMIFGGLLFIGGLIGILVILYLSVANPIIFNGVSGLKGFLLSYKLEPYFVIFCILSLTGIILCAIEAYKKK